MKKISTLVMMAVIAATSFSLVSCDDDHWHDGPGWNDGPNWRDDQPQEPSQDPLIAEAQTLVGEWYGPVKYTYYDKNGQYGEDDFYADMIFYQSSNENGKQDVGNSLKGGGMEIDYVYDEKGDVAESQNLPFTWYIDQKGNIYITYTSSGATFMLDAGAQLHGFYLGKHDDYKNDIFSGWMIGINRNDGDLINIQLERVVTDRSKARKLTQGSTTAVSAASASDSSITSFGKWTVSKMPKFSTQSLNHRR